MVIADSDIYCLSEVYVVDLLKVSSMFLLLVRMIMALESSKSLAMLIANLAN